MPVEVPGGSQKEFLIVAPSGVDPTQSPDVVARLLQGDQVWRRGSVTVRSAVDTELVGLLPGALRGRPVPGPAPLAVDAGTARFAAIGEADLEQAPASLGPAVHPGRRHRRDRPALARARAGVLRWMEDRRAAARGLGPGPGRARPARRVAAGRAGPGRRRARRGGGHRRRRRRRPVVGPDRTVRAGGWCPGGSEARCPWPAPWPPTPACGRRRSAGSSGSSSSTSCVVGPVVFFAVRRRGRPELAWVAVPLVALLFTSGSWAVGRNLRKATELVHASVITTGAGGPVASTYVGVFSRSRGDGTHRVPCGLVDRHLRRRRRGGEARPRDPDLRRTGSRAWPWTRASSAWSRPPVRPLPTAPAGCRSPPRPRPAAG